MIALPIPLVYLESLKERVEKATGWARPSRRDLDGAIKRRKPHICRFKDDGVIPNNPDLPFVPYRSPVALADEFDPAAVFEDLIQQRSSG